VKAGFLVQHVSSEEPCIYLHCAVKVTGSARGFDERMCQNERAGSHRTTTSKGSLAACLSGPTHSTVGESARTASTAR